MSVYSLELTYQDFLNNQKSIAHSRIDNFIVYEKLGSGAFGSVYRGMNDTTKKEVAIKVLDLVAIEIKESSSETKEVLRRLAKTESELMMKVNSEHVMKLFCIYENAHLKIMVVEYCNGGSLQSELDRRKKIPEEESIEIIKQIILGLADMHKMNIAHRDLKTDNIMSHNGIYKIIDLGFARIIPNEKLVRGTILGSNHTMAPEVHDQKKYGLKADMWAIGVILYQMIYGELPYPPMKSEYMIEEFQKRDIFPNDGEFNGVKPSNEVIELMKKLLTIDKKQRIGWNDLILEKLLQDKENLCENYRVSVSIEKLKKEGKFEENEMEEIEFLRELEDLKVEEVKVEMNKVKVERLTPEEWEKKGNELDRSEEQIIKWAMTNHLECLKTELILKEIIIQIESNNLLDGSRKSVEFLYLLTSRCFFNMSFVLYDFVDSDNPIVTNLKRNVERLYEKVCKIHEYYSLRLTKKENKLSSIFKDRVSKMFDSKEFQNKDKFLIGIENIEFKKEEQILYTYNSYIKEIINQIDPKYIKLRAKLKNYLVISNIQENDIKTKKFHEVVLEIIKKDLNQQ